MLKWLQLGYKVQNGGFCSQFLGTFKENFRFSFSLDSSHAVGNTLPLNETWPHPHLVLMGIRSKCKLGSFGRRFSRIVIGFFFKGAQNTELSSRPPPSFDLDSRVWIILHSILFVVFFDTDIRKEHLRKV